MKQCRKCNQQKPLTEFYKATSGTRDGHRHECRSCWTEASKKYYKENRENRRVKNREYHYQSKYGISVSDFEKMKEEVSYKCEACGQEKPLVVDHCHTSGKVRGILCNPCNQALGSLYESEEFILGLLEYLRKHT